MARSKVNSRSDHDAAQLHPQTNVSTKYQLPIPYGFQDIARTRFYIYLFIWGFYVAFNTVQVISRRVVERAEETSTYSSLGFCTVNCRPMASNYQLSHLRP